MSRPLPPPEPVTLREAFWYWLNYQLRRLCRADRHHAPGLGGEKTLDFREPLLARAQLLHVAAGPGSAAVGDLHRLADAPHLGRHPCRRPVRVAVVTYLTFLPSFLFILAGGPLVESTHGNLKFTAPLTGITAAVVGVIVNLAAFFAYHVFWPQGFSGRFDAVSALFGLSALLRYKAGVFR